MRELFDLLQGEVESWDGVCDQTLSEKNRQVQSFSGKCTFLKYDFKFGCNPRCTSGGVFAVGVVRDVLDEALEGEGLIDNFESLSALLVTLPFT